MSRAFWLTLILRKLSFLSQPRLTRAVYLGLSMDQTVVDISPVQTSDPHLARTRHHILLGVAPKVVQHRLSHIRRDDVDVELRSRAGDQANACAQLQHQRLAFRATLSSAECSAVADEVIAEEKRR